MPVDLGDTWNLCFCQELWPPLVFSLLLKPGRGLLFTVGVSWKPPPWEKCKQSETWLENLRNVGSLMVGTSVTSSSSQGVSRFHSDIRCGGLDLAALSWWRSGCVGSFSKSVLDSPNYWAVGSVGCWGNTPAFVQVLLGSRGSLSQDFCRVGNPEL